MAESGWVEGDALEGMLPHRGVNMLIDAVRTWGEGESARGEGRLRLSPGDARGRDIFLREAGGPAGPEVSSAEATEPSEAFGRRREVRPCPGACGGRVIMGPALAEHLALDAICVLRPDMAPGGIAFFSVISSFELVREIRSGEAVLSEVRRLRDKGRFRRFEGTVRGEDGETAASAEIMAYTAEPASPSGRRESGKLLAPPVVRETRPVDRALFGWKRPEMVFAADRVNLSPEMDQATLRYTYPPDHPFCPGHFPDNPVMMGVTQWIAAADAAAFLLLERVETGLESAGEGRWEAQADILRERGGLVAEVRGLVFAMSVSAGGVGPVRIERTKRVGFRDQVRPGETIFVRVRVSPAR